MNSKIALECPECDAGTLEQKTVPLTGTVRGESFTVNSEALVCSKCVFKTVPKERMGEFALRIADAYREQHHLLTSSEIKDRRANLRMTQQQFANYLCVGVASVRRWELGQIQDEAMNALMALKTDIRSAEQNVVEVYARLRRPLWSGKVVEGYRSRLDFNPPFAAILKAIERPGFGMTEIRVRKAAAGNIAHSAHRELDDLKKYLAGATTEYAA